MTADISMDYEHYPTLAPLPEGMETPNAYVCCPVCGSTTFQLRKSDNSLVCSDCREEMTVFSSGSGEYTDPDDAEEQFFHRPDSMDDNSPGISKKPSIRSSNYWQDFEDSLTDDTDADLSVSEEEEPDFYIPEDSIPAASAAPRFQIVRTKEHSVVLRPDGTVQAIGVNKYGQCNVQDWRNINAVAATGAFTVGLGSDGKIRYAGNNWLTRNKFNSWNNITSIASGNNFVVGLCRDGSVKSFGFRVPVYSGITAIAAGTNHLVALSVDGSVRAVGPNSYGMCNVQDWSGIKAIAAGSVHTAALRDDGTVIATGFRKRGKFEKLNRCELHAWVNIVAIDAGSAHTVGLRADGKVFAAGYNKEGQCNVWEWTNVVAICAGESYTAALRADGTILCTDPTVKKLIEEAYGIKPFATLEQPAPKTAPGETADGSDSGYDMLFSDAVDLVLESKQASVSLLQRRLTIGYSRAARLIDLMEARGLVGPFQGSKPRTILITKEQWEQMKRTGSF